VDRDDAGPKFDNSCGSQVPQRSIHMDARQAGRIAQIRLGDRQWKGCPVAMTGLFATDRHLAKNVRQSRQCVASTDVHDPFGKYRAVCHTISPEGLRYTWVFGSEPPHVSVRNLKNGGVR
jgi:hypothetical protein